MRTISWFSCGAASAVATKLAIGTGEKIEIAYCEVMEEHPDNKRFLKECEEWFGQEITIIGNDKYDRSIYEVFRKDKFLVGAFGARCTLKLKKEMRKSFEKLDDRQVFGYTVEEQNRVDRFIDANNDVDIWPILIEKNLTKEDCLAIIKDAGIELPEMYKLGYHNNNCIGCVKGGSGYWNKIRVDFPDTFERMAKIERLLGRQICKSTIDGEQQLVYLDELDPTVGNYPAEPNIECGIFCHMAKGDM